MLMSVVVNFLVMFTNLGHIHLVILNWSSEHSSIFLSFFLVGLIFFLFFLFSLILYSVLLFQSFLPSTLFFCLSVVTSFCYFLSSFLFSVFPKTICEKTMYEADQISIFTPKTTNTLEACRCIFRCVQ